MNLSPKIKTLVRRWIPPGLRELFNRFAGTAIVFEGSFRSWEDAMAAAEGYANSHLFEHLESAALRVKNAEAKWEQDGVVHDLVPPDFPQLACLAMAAISNNGRSVVLDFGGGFGSSYFQAREHLSSVAGIEWHVVEQQHIVDSGKKNFETINLHFHSTIRECLAVASPNVALLSGVLQYLPDPESLIAELSETDIEFLIIDRTAMSQGEEAITIQKLPKSLYQGSYPTWLFDPEAFNSFLSKSHQLLVTWDGKDPPISGSGLRAKYVGSLWRKRTQA